MKKFLVIILIVFISFGGTQVLAQHNKPLTDSVIRLHVIANSDKIDDQALKLAVKDHIVSYMQEEFLHASNIEDARIKAENNLANIKREAEAAVVAEGYNYPVEVSLGTFTFPTKSYGNLVFPSGDYYALKVIIGEGSGKNWWCVLFPPLCIVSSSDKGLSLENPREAKVTLKCLELLPKGVKLD